MRYLLLLLAAGAVSLNAGAATPVKTIPVDPELRTGKLENGLTYYVRHNDKPKGQASLHLVQNSGSILEEDNERGFAHFLEHMCFNGSEHFPGNSMVSWLKRQGVMFGSDLNAYTTMDGTVYSIDNMPATRQSALDTCLLIMHDWCCGLSFDPVEVEKERGVVLEERRSHRGANQRMYEQILKKIYPDSCRYSDRMPIGSLEVLQSFRPDDIRSFWRKWSRPDLQAVVVVGDIDADAMVERIKEVFSDIPAAGPDAPERTEEVVPDNGDEPVIAFVHDKEQTVPVFYIYKKQGITPREDRIDEDYYWMLFIQKLMNLMITGRVSEWLSDPASPWTDIDMGETDYFVSKTKGAWMGVEASYTHRAEEGLAGLYREMLRIERHGFTQEEYNNAMKELMGRLEKEAAAEAETASWAWCSVYDSNYLDNEPMMTAAQELELARNVAAQMDAGFVNFYCTLMPKANLTVIGMLPEGFPEPDVEALLEEVGAEEIPAYEDKSPVGPLMASVPRGGSSEKVGESISGYEEFVLGNGATVYVKNTDFTPNNIQIRVFSNGGTSVYEDSEQREFAGLDDIFLLGGLGDLSRHELSRSLSGKQVSFTPEIGSYSEGMYGASTVEDFETLLQLTYLTFTQLRADSTAFESYRARRKAAVEADRDNVQTALNDTINAAVYCGHPRVHRLTPEDIDDIDYGRVMQMASERFADAADFSFIFTGRFDAETMMPLIESYIGSLPSTGGPREGVVNRKCTIVPGRRSRSFSRPMETPVAASVRIFSRKADYTLRENMVHELLGKCLTSVLEREIREEEGATYSIQANATMSAFPTPMRKLQIFYQTDPARQDEVAGKVAAVLKDFARRGPSEDILDEVVEYKLKRYRENLESNAWYSTILMEYLQTGVNFGDGYDDMVKSVSAADLAWSLRRLMRSGNEVSVSLTGTEE